VPVNRREDRHAFRGQPIFKGSEQEGLTGVKGSVLRKVVVDKTRSSLESALAFLKRTVEQSTPLSGR
jgi:hypothetical protein